MIVLTGGAGFIGSCFLKTLNDKGINNVLVVDHLGNKEKWKNLQDKNFVNYINKVDFRQLLKNPQFGNEIKTIFHFGACSSTTESNADYLIDNNYAYSRELAEFALLNDIRFIYASSAATYGNGSNGYSDANIDGLKPLNCYGFSKHLFDKWVVGNGYDNKFVGLKFFNVFGPNEYHKDDMASMVFKSFNQIYKSSIVKLFKSNSELYPNGGQMRDFIYVKDACKAIWDIYQNNNVSGIYNLGTGKARSWNDLVSAVFMALGKEWNVEYIDIPDNISKQYQNFTEAEMNKLSQAGIVFEPSSLEDSIRDYVQNYLSKDYLIY